MHLLLSSILYFLRYFYTVFLRPCKILSDLNNISRNLIKIENLSKIIIRILDMCISYNVLVSSGKILSDLNKICTNFIKIENLSKILIRS